MKIKNFFKKHNDTQQDKLKIETQDTEVKEDIGLEEQENKAGKQETQTDATNENGSQLESLKIELKRVQYKRRFQKVLRSTISILIVVAAIAALIATLVLPVLEISGTSMEPSLQAGDMVALVKTSDLEHGDLCAFYYSNKVLIKRVIAVPGDYLWIESDGTVVLNGKKLDEPYVTQKALGECDIEFPYQVPESQYFMMGDQRETSIDSRSSKIGCITEEQIIGKLLFRFWPLNNFKLF